MKKRTSVSTGKTSASQQPADWRLQTISRIRAIIERADPEAVEEVKWRKPSNPAGVPVWSHAGILCTAETYKDKVKVTFAKGAALDDSAGLFNSSLAGTTRRAIDFYEGDKVDAKALKALILAAVELNIAKGKRGSLTTVRPARFGKQSKNG